MVQRSTHPPAWYPDPEDPARIRRWNGKAWTDDVRPLPDWLRTLRLAPGPEAKVRRTGQRLWMTSAALLLIGTLLMIVLSGADDSAERIDDRNFLTLANTRCAQTETAVVSPNRQPREGLAEARRIEALATGWEAMVVDLRALPLDPVDAPKVDRWLRAWNGWTSLGREYADALRADDQVEADAVLRRSQVQNATMTRFALVNGMDDCLFRTG